MNTALRVRHLLAQACLNVMAVTGDKKVYASATTLMAMAVTAPDDVVWRWLMEDGTQHVQMLNQLEIDHLAERLVGELASGRPVPGWIYDTFHARPCTAGVAVERWVGLDNPIIDNTVHHNMWSALIFGLMCERRVST